MDIASLSALSNAQNKQNIERTGVKLQQVIASIVTGDRAQQIGDDVAAITLATRLQASVANLRQASTNLAQASSLAQIADGGASQIQGALQQLQSLATQANAPTLNSETRSQLNQQFKQLVSQIDSVVNGTSFNGKALLNGNLSGNNGISLYGLLSAETEPGDGQLSIDSLSSAQLFNGKNLSLLSQDGAKDAASAIADALKQITAVRVDIGTFQQSLNFAGANLESALTNQQAATSDLQDTDFTAASAQLALLTTQRDLAIAVTAQGNKLTPTILKLIG